MLSPGARSVSVAAFVDSEVGLSLACAFAGIASVVARVRANIAAERMGFNLDLLPISWRGRLYPAT